MGSDWHLKSASKVAERSEVAQSLRIACSKKKSNKLESQRLQTVQVLRVAQGTYAEARQQFAIDIMLTQHEGDRNCTPSPCYGRVMPQASAKFSLSLVLAETSTETFIGLLEKTVAKPNFLQLLSRFRHTQTNHCASS